MPLIRTAIIHPGGRKQKTISHYKSFLKVKPAKTQRAKIKGVQVGHGNTGKETQHTVQRRMADPNRPIAPAGPRPPSNHPNTYSKHLAAGGDRKSWIAHVKNYQDTPAQAAHSKALRNDPGFHKATAQAMNAERATRAAETRPKRPKKPRKA